MIEQIGLPLPSIQPRPALAHSSGKLTQLGRVRTVLGHGGWMTLAEIARASFHIFGKIDTECAVSARIRSLAHEKRRRGGRGSLWEYRLS